MLKILHDNKGMTLVELLGAFVILLIVSLLTVPILLNGIKSAQSIQLETQFRNEADYLMSNFIKELYTAKESELLKTNMDDKNKSNSYLVNKKNNTKTGIYNGELLISNNVIKPSNAKIVISPSSTFETINVGEHDKGKYELMLVLEIKGKKKMTFTNVLTTIDDEEDENE